MNKVLDVPDIWRGSLEFKVPALEVHNGTNNTYGIEEFSHDHEEYNKHAVLSVVTGILMIILINLKHTKALKKRDGPPKKSPVAFIVCSIISIALSPIVFATIITFSLYRRFVELLLRKKYGPKFRGLLEGTDAVWALEDVSRSVINVLALVEHEQGGPLLEAMREKISEMLSNECLKKLHCYREKRFGYYFWMEDEIVIEKHVRELPVVGKLSKVQLEHVLGSYVNAPLPENHRSALEILVGAQPVAQADSEAYPVLFRVHHSVGDGIVLISILLNSLADKYPQKTKEIVYTELPPSPKIVRISYKKEVKRSARKTHVFRNVALATFGPGVLIQQFLARKADNNVLHNNNLCGDKTIVWLAEDEPCLIDTIKRTKRRFSDVSFSDILLTALSASFKEYFQKNDVVPDTITVVVPARIPDTEHTKNSSGLPMLQNRFSVAMLNLPVDIMGTNGLIDRMFEIKKETDVLKKSADYQVNYWLLSVISKILPECLLRPMVYSAQSTTVVSNVPGPNQMSICNGHRLKNLVFWLPNRGTTGLGVSVLSYGGRLQLGLIADKSLISSAECAQTILQDIFKYLKDLDEVSASRANCS